LGSNCVLLLHGLASHKDHNFAPALAAAISARAQLSVLRFNFRSVAPSPLEPEHRFRICGSPDDVDDVRAALDALRARGLRAVALVGHSRGAIAALHSAAQVPALAGLPLVLLAPRWEADAMLSGPFFAAQRGALAALEAGSLESFVWATRAGDVVVTREDVAALRAAGTMARPLADLRADARVLIVHGTGDRIIAVESAEAFRRARPQSVRVQLVPEADHNFEAPQHAAALIDGVVDFLVAAAAADAADA
jgi:pimeloyl-ACP methyl ester carboxylesterase